ncbi:MAG: dTDP-4-dehydrorhamnose reductase, partial [Planctomycetota bacterium]
MKILILGSQGNLGQDLVSVFSSTGHEVVGCGRDKLDVTDQAAVRAMIGRGFSAVINAVAYNNVDGAEDPASRQIAWKLNAEVPGELARAAREAGAAFVHYSTDYVFAGDKPEGYTEGYTEDDTPAPISVYGESKLAGEQAVAAAGGRFYVCRLSKIFGKPGPSKLSKPSFVSVMVGLAKTKPALSIVDEQVGSPTYTRDVATATLRLLTEQFPAGIYHLVNEGPGVTWYGFAEEFFGLLGIQTPRTPVTSAAFPKPARRPPFAVLRNTKFPPLRSRLDALRA